MFDNDSPVHVVNPHPLNAGGEAMGALVVMLSCMWAYAVSVWFPSWSFDAKFFVFVSGALVFLIWIRFFAVLSIIVAVGMIITARL